MRLYVSLPISPQTSAARMIYKGMRSQGCLRFEYDSHRLKEGETWCCRYAYAYGLDGSDKPCFVHLAGAG